MKTVIINNDTRVLFEGQSLHIRQNDIVGDRQDIFMTVTELENLLKEIKK